jgi:glycosyltransferase involved in cell wall biosynthesis
MCWSRVRGCAHGWRARGLRRTARWPRPRRSGPGDRLVSLGLDWDYLDQKVLYQLKQRHGLRTTLICYDVIPALFPQLVVLPPGGFGAYLVDMAWCADEVLCISHHTRKDCEAVLSRLGAPVPPMHVIHLGSEVHASGEPARAPAGLAVGEGERPFVLFVSTIERRKNHEILYRAWTRLRDQGVVPHRLVFVGMQGWGVTDLLNDMRLDPRTQSDIVLLNHVSDAELDWLYRHAAFTVFPSLYEGWGLPLVESLARGKFCLASSAASLPEAGGPHAEYLDPWDLPAWVDRLGHYMAHPEEVEARNERIRREFRAPSWADTARQIHQVALAAGRGQP